MARRRGRPAKGGVVFERENVEEHLLRVLEVRAFVVVVVVVVVYASSS